jgi:peptidoglycan/xylan/chitin deacetylase (PgdA/CDA1 family)
MSVTHQFEAPIGKRILAEVYCVLQFHRLDEWRRRLSGPALLAVNYHKTPVSEMESLEGHLRWYRDAFEPISPEQLDRFLSGDWHSAKPGLMIHFDDGNLDNAVVAAPLLEKYHMTGWFHVITDNLDRTSRPGAPSDEWMKWSHARELVRKGHAICSHTCSHRRLKPNVPDTEVAHEVMDSYDRILSETGQAPLGFCWPGGEPDTYDPRAFKGIVARYRYAFPGFTKTIRPGDSPYCLPRANVEAHWSLPLLRLSLGGLWEFKHRSKAEDYIARLSSAL